MCWPRHGHLFTFDAKQVGYRVLSTHGRQTCPSLEAASTITKTKMISWPSSHECGTRRHPWTSYARQLAGSRTADQEVRNVSLGVSLNVLATVEEDKEQLHDNHGNAPIVGRLMLS